MKRFDLIIVGGGAGGFAAAIKANDLGARTALVNAGLPLGETCVNVGCVPSKTLLWAAEVLHLARQHRIPGLEFDAKRVDVAAIVQDELAFVDQLQREKYAGVLRELEHVTLLEGAARFATPSTIRVNGEELVSERFVIATGATATVPDIPELRDVGFMTHIEALRRERPSESLAVIGAGPLGLEFSQLFSRFGTHVTTLQRRPSVFPRSEPALAQRLTDILSGEGITVMTRANPTRVSRSGDRKRVEYEIDGRITTVEAEEILLAAGKTPNTAGLALERSGVALNSRQAVAVDEFLRTSMPHIYAVGDVNDRPAIGDDRRPRRHAGRGKRAHRS